jgi:tripartite-type tricarboxylate transporter receptor subunit TctC
VPVALRSKQIGRSANERHKSLAALTCVAALAVAAGVAAQTLGDYPNRPIRIIVTQAAGSGMDIQARVLAQKIQGRPQRRPR